jgi:hypothetical protein
MTQSRNRFCIGHAVSLADDLRKMQATANHHAVACRQVWAAIQAEHPDIAATINQLGWSEDQTAQWVCKPHSSLGGAPAELITLGDGDKVRRLVNRVLHGFF